MRQRLVVEGEMGYAVSFPEEKGRQVAQQHALTLRVNDRCTLSAGSWQTERDEQQESFRLVSSPEPPMYQQLLASLTETTKDQKVPPKSHLHFGEVALATVLVCIRWGSYFAVLVNPD